MSSPVSWEDYATGPSECAPEYASLWDGLVGLWAPALGPTGNALFDLSGLNNHGTLTNMDPATDWVGSPGGWALGFDGIGDFVQLGYSDALTFQAQQFTVLVDCKKAAGSRQLLVSQPYHADHVNPYLAWGLYVNDSYGVECRTGVTVVTSEVAVFKVGVYHRYAQVFDGIANTVSWYRDGVLLNASTHHGTIDQRVQAPRIGANMRTDEEFSGSISSLALYDRALPADEVRAWSADPFGLLRPAGFGAELWYSGGAPPAGSSIPAIYDYYRRLRCA
jgi:hypothetical protein